jgi:hypothetical protein
MYSIAACWHKVKQKRVNIIKSNAYGGFLWPGEVGLADGMDGLGNTKAVERLTLLNRRKSMSIL